MNLLILISLLIKKRLISLYLDINFPIATKKNRELNKTRFASLSDRSSVDQFLLVCLYFTVDNEIKHSS